MSEKDHVKHGEMSGCDQVSDQVSDQVKRTK